MNDFLVSLNWPAVRGFALQAALCGVGICAVVLVAARLLRRRSEPLRYGIFLGGVLGLLAVPVLVGAGQWLPAGSLWAAVEPEEEVLRVPAELLPALLNRPLEEPPADMASVTSLVSVLGGALLALWTLGAALGLGRLASAWRKTRAIVGQPWRADFWTAELQAQLARKVGLKKFPDVLLSPVAPMPMVVGLWRPTIVVPQQAPATWGQPQWEAVLLHEAAHVARRDPWAALAQRIAVILFWWCPLVYVLSRRLSELRENICDDCALAGPCDRLGYAELLLESAERLLSLKTASVPLGLLDSARGGLEARVTRLLDKERRPMTRLSLPGKLLGGGFLAAACLLTTAATALSQAQPQPAKKVQIKLIVDGKEIDLSDAQAGDIVRTTQPKVKTGNTELELRFLPLAATAPAEAGKIAAELVFTQAKPDARIEELVKQAEAIKPGSGAAIRRALQGESRPGEPVQGALQFLARQVQDPKAVPADRLIRPPGTSPAQLRVIDSAAGKKIIIVIEDGKVQHLTEQDLKKLLDAETAKSQDVRAYVRVEKALPAAGSADAKLVAEVLSKTLSTARPAGTPAAADLEGLRRQLERINAELNELRRRLDAGKK